MGRFFCILFVPGIVLTACVSKHEARLQAQQAFMAGQQQATREWQEKRLPEVLVRGPVRNPTIPWQDGMSLAQAIVAADYTAFMNPTSIRVIRDGKIVEELKGIDLLHRQDFPLQAGDIVDIAR